MNRWTWVGRVPLLLATLALTLALPAVALGAGHGAVRIDRGHHAQLHQREKGHHETHRSRRNRQARVSPEPWRPVLIFVRLPLVPELVSDAGTDRVDPMRRMALMRGGGSRYGAG